MKFWIPIKRQNNSQGPFKDLSPAINYSVQHPQYLTLCRPPVSTENCCSSSYSRNDPYTLLPMSYFSAALHSIFEMVSAPHVLLPPSHFFLNSLQWACKATTHKHLLLKAINTSLLISLYSRLLPTPSFSKHFLLLASVKPHFSRVSSYSPLCLYPWPLQFTLQKAPIVIF